MKKTIKKQSKIKANKKAGLMSDLFGTLFNSAATIGVLGAAMKTIRDKHFEQPIEYKCGYLLKDKATLFVCNDHDKLSKWINSNYFEEYENIKVFKNNSITADRIRWRFDEHDVNTDPKVLEQVRPEYIKEGYTFWTKKKYYYVEYGYSKLKEVEPFRFDGLKLVVVA